MQVTLQSVLRESFETCERRVRVPARVRRAARALMRCRTAELGGEVRRCPDGHVSEIRYRSCGDRACPQCGARRLGESLERWKALLLPIAHFHVVFTLPSELHVLWQYNRRVLSELLFRCVHETLTTLLWDPRRLGAQIGVLAALHTWGRTLVLHPHVHCLVTGGGLDGVGHWRAVTNGYLLPVAVLRKMFRGKLLAGIEALSRQGRLRLPPTADAATVRRVLRQAAAKKWNIRVGARYAHGHGVAIYLARYARGGPIKNPRFVRADAQTVTFWYADHRQASVDGRLPHQQLTLSTEEFVRRWSQHVPPTGQHTVRTWGLYAASQRHRLEQCRRPLEPSLPALPAADTVPQAPAAPRAEDCCPVCGQALIVSEVLPRSGAPPSSPLPARAA